jgi:hypothetical protein
MDIPKKLNREKLYKYGERSENILYEIIKQYRDDTILTDRYNHFDYIIENDDTTILIELKTRTHLKDTHKTTYFPLSKIKYYNQYKKQNGNKKCFFIIVIGFPTDTTDIDNCDFEYHAIQYKPKTFNNYELTNNADCTDKNVNIIIDDLKPVKYYLDVFKEHYKKTSVS